MKRTQPAIVIFCCIVSLAGAQENPVSVQPAGGDASVGRRIVTLEEALGLALRTGDDIRISQATLFQARAQHDSNRSKSGVSLSLSGSGTVQGGVGNSGIIKSIVAGGQPGISENIQGSLTLTQGTASQSNPAFRLTVTATQTVPDFSEPANSAATNLSVQVTQSLWDGYPGGQTKALIDKSILALSAKEFAANLARSQVSARVKQAYVAALSAQRTQALRTGLAEKQRALLAQVEAAYSLKQASMIDAMTARVNARSSELDVESAEHDVSLARERLSLLLNLSPDSDFTVAEIETPELPARSADEAIMIGRSKRNDAVLLDVGRKTAAIDLDLARGLSQPGLALLGGLGFGMTWNEESPNAESANVGLRVTLPVLDSGAANAQVRFVSAQIEALEAQSVQLKKTIAADIRDNFWQASIQRKKIDVARESADILGRQLELVKTQNQFGNATTQDILTAMTASANAEAAWAQARAAYLLSVLALETSMGL